jgi:uncharacterized protein YgbK (DUF1537 family)
MAVWIIADDFTGANDSIARFAVAGARSVTIFDPQIPKQRLSDYQAVAYSVNSRGMTRDAAYRVNCDVVRGLHPVAEDLIYKKMDSALRGNLGAELEAVLDEVGPEATILVAPALPANQRITVGGYQLLNGIPVHETEMARDPVTPVRESHLPTLLAQTCHYQVGYLSLGTVCDGVTKINTALQEQIAAGCRIMVADATRDEHLDRLAQISVDSSATILLCGTAGLAGALARRLFQASEAKDLLELTSDGSVAAVIGSKSSQAVLQIRQALNDLPWMAELAAQRTSLGSLRQRRAEVQRIGEQAAQMLTTGLRGVLVRLDDDPAVDSKTLDAQALAAGMGELARFLVETTGIKVLYLSGGDIAVAAVTALGGWGLAVEAELDAGVCIGSLRGGRFEGLKVITKAGSFGDAGTLTRALRFTVKN